ncbi:MAG: hypothetical protein II822_09560 [Prevotella sp.]|nr:hypothetical protein [Prevotella sp.]
MKKYLFLAVVSAAMTVASCESEESLSIDEKVISEEVPFEKAYKVYEDSIKTLGWEDREDFFYKTRFMSLADQAKAGLLASFTRGEDLDPNDPSDPLRPNLRIRYNMEWGINVFNHCFGYGVICKIDFYLDTDDDNVSVHLSADEGVVNTDINGNKYIDFLFEETPDTTDVPALIVSEDMETEVLVPSELEEYVTNDIPEYLTVPQGDYPYDSTLGTHGGYRIYLTPSNGGGVQEED